MPEDDANSRLADVMTRASLRIVAGERSYEVCVEACGPLTNPDIFGKADHDGAAYILLAEISDLYDSPWGPRSKAACDAMALAVATDWLAIDAKSVGSVSSFFQRWEPAKGASWLTVSEQSFPTSKDGRVQIPTGEELVKRFEALLPAAFVDGFRDDVQGFADGAGRVTPCGALWAFSWSFDRCIAAGAADTIQRALEYVDGLLMLAAPTDIFNPVRRDLYDAVLTCFYENVLPTTVAGHPLVVPHLGPRVHAFADRFNPEWLRPDPSARLAT